MVEDEIAANSELEKSLRSERIKRSFSIGLIVLGVFFLLGNLFFGWGMEIFWPIFPLLVSFFFFYLYFSKVKESVGVEGVLIPGVILLVVSLLFFFLNFTGWDLMQYLWPTFPLSVGLSFLVAEYASAEAKGLRGAAKFLIYFSIVFYVLGLISYRVWPLVLILIGIYLIVRHSRKTGQ
jgi:hypothetical protein